MTKFISNNNIFQLAKDFKAYVERNGEIPFKLSYGGIEFVGCEMQDIMTYALLNLSSNCNVGNTGWCINATGDTINENVLRDDYLDQAKRVHDYVVKYNKMPNYVTTKKSKKKVNIDLYSYCIAKILVFYKNTGALPNYCLYNTQDMNGGGSSTGKHGHATKSGCDQRGQNNGYYCGCHSLQEVFRNLYGIVVPQATIAGWAGTTSSGTGHSGLETAVAKFNQKYGKNLKLSWKNFSDLGWNGINNILKSNNQDCIIHNLYRNQWGHYEVVNSISGNNVNVQNSLGSSCSGGCYCGYVETRSQSTFRSYINGISQKSVMVLTRG